MSGSSPIGVRCTVGVGPGTVSAAGVDSLEEHAASKRHKAMPGAILRMTTTIPERVPMQRTWAGAVLLGLLTTTADLEVRTTRDVVPAATDVVQAFRPAAQSAATNTTITSVPGIRVGH